MLTYGNGEVLFDGAAKGFELRYKGSIRVTSSPDNLLLAASKNKIIGVMLDGTDMPQELFNYVGELRVLSCKSVQGEALERERITLQGVDYWELDREKWEDDGSLWGTRDGTYLIGSKQRFNKKRIVVNNNIQSNGKFQYGDGTPLSDNDLIHIMNDGTPMSEGVHSKDSEYIYPYIKKPTVLSKTQYNMPVTVFNTKSLNFDGSDDYVDISITNFCGADFSIGYWSKNDYSSADYWRGISLSPTYQTGMFIAHHRILGQDSDDTTWDKSFPSVGGTTGGTYGAWHYRVVTYDISEKTFTLYVDDATPGTKTIVGNLKTDEDMIRIGVSQAYNFEGNIDEVAVWDTILDADAVTAIYNSGTPINLKSDSGNYDNSANLIGYWRMGDGDTYPTITDNSTNSNDGTMTNMVSGDIEEETP